MSYTVSLNISVFMYVKAQGGSTSQVDSGQLRNPVLIAESHVGPSWLHFFQASQVDSSEHNLCSITKQKLILKILDVVKFTLLNTKILVHTLFLKFFLWYDTNSLLSPGLQKILMAI